MGDEHFETLGLQAFVYLTGGEKEGQDGNGRSPHNGDHSQTDQSQEVEGKTA